MEQWVRQLLLLVLLAGLAEALLPRSELRRYAETALGLLVLLTVLQPVLGLLRGGFPWERALALDAVGGADAAPAQGGDRLREVQRRLVLEAFRHRAEERVRQVIEALPGVAAARVTVRVEGDPTGGDYGRIAGVEVDVTAAEGRRVAREAVREAVRAELGLPPDRVRVTFVEKGGDALGG